MSLFNVDTVTDDLTLFPQIRDWIPGGKNATLVLRFLGTTPKSTQILSVLSNISQHIAAEYHKEFATAQADKDLSSMTSQFLDMLQSGTESKPLVVILDSLDQLSPRNYAHKLGWLPRYVPEHCYIVVSTLPEHWGILEILRGRNGKDNMIEIPPLGEVLSSEILQAWLDAENRTLSESQFLIAKEAFQKCSLPLYVKLIFEQVVTWKSYDQPEKTVVSHAVRQVINDLFQRVEKKHGTLLVQRTLGYITASRGGLSEGELEDLLSLDDDVLTDVFQYHVPPTRRIPPSLWVRIKHDIHSYLSTRETDATTVIYWYHRQFIEAAQNRYIPSDAVVLHSKMADFYRGTWHGKEKPFTYTDFQMRRLKLTNPDSQAERYVSAQPMVYTDGKDTRFNVRKLNNLPYHLANAGKMDVLKTECLFNYDWLHTKLLATSVQSIMDDLAFVSTEDAECSLLKTVLNLARSTMSNSPDTLAVEIIGRLKPYRHSNHKHISRLVDQCYEMAPKHNALLPRQQCFTTTGGSLKFAIEHQDHPPTQKILAMAPDCKSMYIGTVYNSLLKWDLDQGEVEKEITLWQDKNQFKFNVIGANHDRSRLVVGTAYQTDRNPVVLVDGQQGEVVGSIDLQKIYPNVGFIDDCQLFILENNQLLAIVAGKAVDCFDLKDGSLKHSFDFLPGASCISQPTSKGLISVKGSSQVKLCDLLASLVIISVDLLGIPKYIYLNKSLTAGFATYGKGCEFTAIELVTKTHELRESNLSTSDMNIQAISMSPSDTYLILRGTAEVELWSTKKMKRYFRFTVPSYIIPEQQRVPDFVVQVTADESKLVVGYYQYLIVWGIATRSIIRVADTLRKIDTLTLTEDSQQAITTFLRNRLVCVWDLVNLDEETHKPLALESGCRYLGVGRHTRTLVVRGYTSNECRTVSLDDGCISGKPTVEVETIAPIMSANGSVFVLRDPGRAGGPDVSSTCMTVCKTSTGEPLGFIPVKGLYLKTFTLSNNGDFVISHEEASPTEDVVLTMWLTDGGLEEKRIPAVTGGIGYMFTADNDSLLVAQHQYPLTEQGRKCTIKVYDLHDNVELYTIENVLKDSLYVTPDTKTIVYVKTGADQSADKLVIQEARNPQLFRENVNLPIGRFNFSSAASRAVDTEIRAFDLKADKILATFTNPNEIMITKQNQTWPKITEDGQHVVFLILRKGVVQVGHIDSGQVIGRCFIHAVPLAVLVSANTVIVGADDGRIVLLEIFDVINGDERTTERLKAVAKFTPKASKIVTTSGRSMSALHTSQSACCDII